MTALHPPRGGRHARRRTHGLIFWLVLADAALFALFALCVIAGGIRGLGAER